MTRDSKSAPSSDPSRGTGGPRGWPSSREETSAPSRRAARAGSARWCFGAAVSFGRGRKVGCQAGTGSRSRAVPARRGRSPRCWKPPPPPRVAASRIYSKLIAVEESHRVGGHPARRSDGLGTRRPSSSRCGRCGGASVATAAGIFVAVEHQSERFLSSAEDPRRRSRWHHHQPHLVAGQLGFHLQEPRRSCRPGVKKSARVHWMRDIGRGVAADVLLSRCGRRPSGFPVPVVLAKARARLPSPN